MKAQDLAFRLIGYRIDYEAISHCGWSVRENCTLWAAHHETRRASVLCRVVVRSESRSAIEQNDVGAAAACEAVPV